jgi:hypothetical protein
MPTRMLVWRTSGRDLTEVRRPSTVVVTPTEPADTTVVEPDLEALKKPELVALAEERGVDASGTKADIIDRLGGP